MRKKKILFIAPDYYGFNEVVFEGLRKYSDCRVIHVNSTAKYQYKNFQERVYNFFLKIFCGKNIKKLKEGQHIKNIILNDKYDMLIVNAPYVLSEENLNLAFSRAKKSVVVFWDSMEKIPMQKDYLTLFDICYSFDDEDCKKYGCKKITNFYFVEEKQKLVNFDVSYLATYDHRIHHVISIFEYFKDNNISAKCKIFTYPSIKIKEKLPINIEVIHKIIPFAESYQYYQDSKVILDIAHPHQRGLSFRPFEAMGMSKKLITTNKNIVNYDFYNPNNIFIIDNINNITIPISFFKTDYQEIDPKIKEKYHLKNWIKKILSYED